MSGASVTQKPKTRAFRVAPRPNGATSSLLKSMRVSPEKALGTACHSLASRLVGKAWVDQRQLDREVSDITKGQAWLDTYIGAQFRPVQLAPRVVGYFPKHQVAHPQPRTQACLHFSSQAEEDATVLPPNNDSYVCGCCGELDTELQTSQGDLHFKLFEEEGQDYESMITSRFGRHSFLTGNERSENEAQKNIVTDAGQPRSLQRSCPWC
ncbi:uncharacterized protein LOC144921035 [Branchiostoma floridae x Branchiostoma belcheri]